MHPQALNATQGTGLAPCGAPEPRHSFVLKTHGVVHQQLAGCVGDVEGWGFPTFELPPSHCVHAVKRPQKVVIHRVIDDVKGTDSQRGHRGDHQPHEHCTGRIHSVVLR